MYFGLSRLRFKLATFHLRLHCQVHCNRLGTKLTDAGINEMFVHVPTILAIKYTCKIYWSSNCFSTITVVTAAIGK